MTRTKYIVSAVLNFLVFGTVLYSLIVFYFGGAWGNMQGSGSLIFRYFTVDSNILAAIACLIVLIYDAKAHFAKTPNAPLPFWVLMVKFVGTVAVTVTFLTVMIFLGPLYGYGPMMEGPNVVLHCTAPLMCVASLLFCEKSDKPITAKEWWWGAVPTVVYGAFYLTLVLAVGVDNGGWPDFYSFNSGPLQGLWPISACVMFGGSYGLAALEAWAQKKIQKTEK